MNGLAKRIKRVAFGMTNFVHWRIRVLVYAGRPDRSKLATVTHDPAQIRSAEILMSAHNAVLGCPVPDGEDGPSTVAIACEGAWRGQTAISSRVAAEPC